MPDVRSTEFDRQAATRKRLNRSILVAACAAIAATGLFAISASRTEFKPTVSVLLPSTAPSVISTAEISQPYRLSDEGVLSTSEGTMVPRAENMVGHVDIIHFEGANVLVTGWAADKAAKLPATRIVVMVNGMSLAVGAPTIRRPDVAAALKLRSIELSGYVVRFPLAEGTSPASTRLKVFALRRDGAAHELIYPVDFPFRRD